MTAALATMVSLLSLDVARKLVAAGLIFKTLTVVGATNATPIVLEVDSNHGFANGQRISGVISSVGGNDAANGYWILTPVDPTHLTLWTYSRQGAVQNSVGTGSYTSGGRVDIAFPDGSILLGRYHVAQSTAVVPPRIVFVPIGQPAWDLEPYGGVIGAYPSPRRRSAETAEQQTMLQQPQLATEFQRFEVHVTGASVPPDPLHGGNLDATRGLYNALYGSMFDMISAPRALVQKGAWVSEDGSMGTVLTNCSKWIGIVEIHMPVVRDPLEFVPVGVFATETVNLINGTSADETIIVLPAAPT